MAKFQSVTLVKGDQTRTAYTQAQLTQAEWDGFAPKAAEDVTAAEKLEVETAKAAQTGKPVPTAVK